jgi:hypothetical protein
MLTTDQVSLFCTQDFVVVPIVVGVLVLVVNNLKKNKFKNNPAKNLLIPALFYKVVLTIIAAYISEYAYSYKVDTHNYFAGVLTIKESILADPTFLQYGFSYTDEELEQIALEKPEVIWMRSASVTKVSQIATPFSFFTGDSYLGISIIFSFFSFYGILKIFQLFSNEYPKLSKQFAYALFFFPSIAFWSSGLLKDPLSILGLGLFVYGAYSIFILKKEILKNLLGLIVGIYLVLVIKPYIIIALIPAFSIWVFRKSNEKIKSKITRNIRSIFAFLILMVGFSFSSVYLVQSESLQQFAVENVLEEVKRQKEGYEIYSGDSNFSLGTFEPTPIGLLKLFPIAVYTTLYRPFLWEVSKPIQFISAIESFVFIIFTLYVLYKIGFKLFFKNLFTNNTIFFCFIFTFIFAGFVAISTANFGSLVRYKIPCLPFYLAALIILLSLKKNKNVRNSSIN